MVFITNSLPLTFEVDRQYLKFSTVGLGIHKSIEKTFIRKILLKIQKMGETNASGDRMQALVNLVCVKRIMK